jgi:preprotein translocase subunit SecY
MAFERKSIRVEDALLWGAIAASIAAFGAMASGESGTVSIVLVGTSILLAVAATFTGIRRLHKYDSEKA